MNQESEDKIKESLSILNSESKTGNYDKIKYLKLEAIIDNKDGLTFKLFYFQYENEETHYATYLKSGKFLYELIVNNILINRLEYTVDSFLMFLKNKSDRLLFIYDYLANYTQIIKKKTHIFNTKKVELPFLNIDMFIYLNKVPTFIKKIQGDNNINNFYCFIAEFKNNNMIIRDYILTSPKFMNIINKYEPQFLKYYNEINKEIIISSDIYYLLELSGSAIKTDFSFMIPYLLKLLPKNKEPELKRSGSGSGSGSIARMRKKITNDILININKKTSRKTSRK